MSDRFGLLHSMTADLGDDFYGILGRIVVLTTLVELKVENLAAALGDEPQEIYARMSVTEHLGYCRDHLPKDASLRAEIEPYLTRVEALRDYRNGLVHSRWPTPEYGWRPPQRKKKRPEEEPDHYLISTRTTPAEMLERLAEAAELVQDGNKLWSRASVPAPLDVE